MHTFTSEEDEMILRMTPEEAATQLGISSKQVSQRKWYITKHKGIPLPPGAPQPQKRVPVTPEQEEQLLAATSKDLPALATSWGLTTNRVRYRHHLVRQKRGLVKTRQRDGKSQRPAAPSAPVTKEGLQIQVGNIAVRVIGGPVKGISVLAEELLINI